MKPATVQKRIEGVLSPVVTPFKARPLARRDKFVRHCKWLLKNGCSGLAIFGTNSEANSLSVEEKLGMLAALIHARRAGRRADARHRPLRAARDRAPDARTR